MVVTTGIGVLLFGSMGRLQALSSSSSLERSCCAILCLYCADLLFTYKIFKHDVEIISACPTNLGRRTHQLEGLE